jgi:hypothetical protein
MNVATHNTGRLIIAAIVRIKFCKIIDVGRRKSCSVTF